MVPQSHPIRIIQSYPVIAIHPRKNTTTMALFLSFSLVNKSARAKNNVGWAVFRTCEGEEQKVKFRKQECGQASITTIIDANNNGYDQGFKLQKGHNRENGGKEKEVTG
jgi:hypothetical protein